MLVCVSATRWCHTCLVFVYTGLTCEDVKHSVLWFICMGRVCLTSTSSYCFSHSQSMHMNDLLCLWSHHTNTHTCSVCTHAFPVAQLLFHACTFTHTEGQFLWFPVAAQVLLQWMQVNMWAADCSERHNLWQIRAFRVLKQLRLWMAHCSLWSCSDCTPIWRVQYTGPHGYCARVWMHRHLLRSAAAACSTVRQVFYSTSGDVIDWLRQGGVYVGWQCQLWWLYCNVDFSTHACCLYGFIFSFCMLV